VKDPIVYIGVLQTLIFALQLVVFGYQAYKLRQTVEASKEQSGDMKLSIAEATRSANAMEISSQAATIASEAAAKSVVLLAKQMRAYLSVRIESGIYQDRAANLRFEVRPLLINAGLTPARKIGYTARADVLPFPLPDDFVFPSLDPPRSAFGILGPQQNFVMNAMVGGDFFDDSEAEDIKRGIGRRLYIWGTVTYEDALGEQRYTQFAHNIFWLRLEDGREPILGNYVDRHNDVT
jgi:hypothetical protein